MFNLICGCTHALHSTAKDPGAGGLIHAPVIRYPTNCLLDKKLLANLANWSDLYPTVPKCLQQEERMASFEWTVAQGKGSVPQHTLYNALARLNGEVNGLTVEEVRKRLEELDLSKMYTLASY